ncbi:DUF4430 domain-containing protein [Paenibacillus anseongense]|uniref:DUF4430 domain-containing protein n=1 Tax=Paenibacillus anseongense TaxID=2682845 RepID=UPI002DBDA3CD|nr:DUF4430 domain-containing protein [Paenibacillus anseongense]MEC0268591.1 DUF4430 domain-containing protein [Paenibacillus anseongense]
MSHRYASKPIIALFMSFVLLFSSLGVLAGPSSQALASTTGPSSIREWLPAPGQFVNETAWGGTGDINSKWTNTPGSTGVSLGSFGGSVVYKFDEPIQNNPKNPYGVDFTVFGNAFAGNEEPAGVAVAQDDGTGNPGPWFYIAGSEHYEDSTIWDYRVTYTNPEPDFTSPNGVNVPWVDNQAGSGEVKTNAYHKHAYYPIPANYPNAPSDFNNQSYTYSGVKINVRKNAFGYPDTHANGSAPYDVPANPYLTTPVKGDPIDISWAVDSAGKPVNLTNVSFVKVYNAVQIDGGALGEIGAEVTSLQKVSVNDAVYETDDLSSIVLSGVGADVTKQVTVTSGVYVYEDIRINADKIKVTANGTASQIFVNNKSGTSGTLIDKEITLSANKAKIVRVIAQEGINTPKIYYLSIIKEANKTALNASITDVESMTKGNYSDTSWQALQNSLAASKQVAADSTAIQDQVDVTLANLLAAVQGLQNNAPPTISVSVIVNGFSAAAGKIVNLAKTDTVVENGSTAAAAIQKVLDANQISVVNATGNYITKIGDLATGDGGTKSGWMYLVNGQFADVGIADYKLKSSDVISLVYTDDYEQDITTTANKTALIAKIAELDALQQGNYTDASWLVLQNSLTLAKAVSANSNAIQYHADSALAKISEAFQNLVTTTGPVDPQTIAVSFTLNGISAAAGKSVTLPKTTINIEPGHTAAYVIEKVLNEAGISFVNENGAYISKVGDLAAFDGGPNSGWLYSVNGVDPDVGIASYVLDHNADIVLRYTDNYLDEYPPTTPGNITVSIIVNGFSATAGKIVNLAKTDTIVEEGSTAAFAIQKVLAEKQIPVVNASGNYITKIGDLDTGDGGTKSGWMYLFNGQFALVGIADYKLNSGDIISLVYTDDYEQDITTTANKTALNAKITELDALQKSNYTDASWLVLQNSLTLAKAVSANIDAIQYHVDSALAKINAAFQNLVTATVPVDPNDPSGGQPSAGDIQAAINAASNYFLSKPSGVSSDWSAIGLARTGSKLPIAYYQKLADSVSSSKGDFKLVTDLERTILGITVTGGDASQVEGYNLIEKLYSHSNMTSQGINGLVFALLALDSKNYSVPENADWTRQKIINQIISRQNQDGGFVLGTGKSDPDITAMTFTALAPYANNQALVQADTLTKAANWLSLNQQSNGGYLSYGVDSSESVSQAIIALTSNNIDPASAKYAKNGVNLLDKLFKFRLPDGSFSHAMQLRSNAMATEQALQALAAYKIFKEGHGERLYDFTKSLPGLEDPAPIQVPLPSGDQPKVVIPSDNQNYLIPITSADANKLVTVEIPKDSHSKVRLDLPTGTSLPRIEAVKGDLSVVIPAGAQITTGQSSALELITTNDTSDATLKNALNTVISSGKKLDTVYHAITLGGNDRIEFDQFVTLVIAGMKGKEAAYIQNGSTKSIQRFSSDAEGLASGKNEYAYDSGSDLIIKTKHFTDFVAYTTSDVTTGPGNGGGGTTPPATKHVTLSVDKLTINKGYVVSETSVELKTGDTAWSVLKRVLETRGINYSAIWNEDYGSIYVQSISGDGEFDHGSGSGWMYNVNGTYPNVGASESTLQDGDSVQWRYTTNLGADLGQDNSQWPKPPVPVTPASSTTVGNKTVFDIPADLKQDYTVNISADLKGKDLITIKIPDVKSRVLLNLGEVKDSIPAITAIKGDITLSIDKGTVLKSGDHNVELLTSINTDDTSVLNLVNNSLNNGSTKLTKINHAFAMGKADQSVLFDRPLTFVIKNGKGQLAGYIEETKFTPIEIYESDTQGMEATKGKEKITYAYVKDQDLIIRTNHFTSFLSYTVGAKDTETTPVFDLKNLYTDSSSISTWAIDAIKEATQKKFIEGNEGKFSPQAAITRSEFTKILVNVLGLEIKKENAIQFQDVSQNDWFYPYVNTAYQAGIISGYDTEHFYPNEKLTREQMAVIIANALALPKADQNSGIEDMEQVSDWAKSSVQTIMANELMTGWNNRFQPGDEVTREMAIVVAMRAYKKR